MLFVFIVKAQRCSGIAGTNKEEPPSATVKKFLSPFITMCTFTIFRYKITWLKCVRLLSHTAHHDTLK